MLQPKADRFTNLLLQLQSSYLGISDITREIDSLTYYLDVALLELESPAADIEKVNLVLTHLKGHIFSATGKLKDNVSTGRTSIQEAIALGCSDRETSNNHAYADKNRA